MKNKKCIILGGNGFIGSNLIKYMSKENYLTLTSFDRNIPNTKIEGVEYLNGDFANDEDLLSAIEGQDIIIHLISTTNPSKSLVNPCLGYDIDIVQTIKILEKIKNTDSKLIFASSGGTVYGEPKTCPIKEEHDLNPSSHYGIIKSTIENIIKMYNKSYGMKNLIMRISNPYGPGQDYKKGVGIIDAIIRKALNDEEIVIWGDGTNVRDYIYIDDLCKAILLMCEYNGAQSIFNIGKGKGYSINEIIDIVRKVLKRDIKVKYEKSRVGDIKSIFLDNSKFNQSVNFREYISIYEGIVNNILFLDKNQDRLKSNYDKII